MAPIKTWKVLFYEGLRFEFGVVAPGELAPEVASWEPTVLRSYLDMRRIEEVWLDEETYDQLLAERNERLDYYPDAEEEENVPALVEVSEGNPDGVAVDPEDPEDIDPEVTETENKEPKKRVVVSRKKAKADGGKQLDEQNV